MVRQIEELLLLTCLGGFVAGITYEVTLLQEKSRSSPWGMRARCPPLPPRRTGGCGVVMRTARQGTMLRPREVANDGVREQLGRQ